LADIKDLGYLSILDTSNDEAIDMLRQVRLRRRTQKNKVTKTTKPKKAELVITPSLASQLLKLLDPEGGE